MSEIIKPTELETEHLVKIDNATEEDIEGMFSVQRSRIVKPEEESVELGGKGFLVYEISRDEFKELLTDTENHLVKVAKDDNGVAGYLVSYTLKQWCELHLGWLDGMVTLDEIKDLLKTNKVMYGRHIAVREDSPKGVGGQLLDETLDDVKKGGYKFYVVEILKDPIENQKSKNFVLGKGFQEIGTKTDENSRVWGVFLKELN